MTSWLDADPLPWHGRRFGRSRYVRLAGFKILALSCALLPGCGPVRTGGDRPVGDAAGQDVMVTMRSLLIRGRVFPDSAIIEPLFLLATSTPTPLKDGGRYQLMGLDAAGDPLFNAYVETTAVADLPDGPEQHFALRIAIDGQTISRLHRVELRADDSLVAYRTARVSASEFSQELEVDNVVTARRLADGRVQLSWDSARFPMVMVSDSRTGDVLAFGRRGEITVSTRENTLEVALSEGVRSGVKTLRIR